MAHDVFITASVRTAIGTFGGRLVGMAPADLGAACVGEGSAARARTLSRWKAILTVKAVEYLRRTRGKRALVTMCIGGGQGIALALAR